MKKYGVMLIGCGHIGAEHLDDIYYRPEFTIEAVVDHNPLRAEKYAQRYGAKAWGQDYVPFLNNDAIDIVIIATYAESHLSILEQCVAAGKHVLCEKPIAITMEEGVRFCQVVKNAKTKVLVAHVLRHNASYRAIAEMIHRGEIGNLRLMRMVQNHHAMNWPRYKKLLENCPPIVDCGVHYLDVMQWFSGSKIVQVSGISTRLDGDAPRDNYGMIHARMANGCVAYYESGWGQNLSAQNIKEFVGDKGRITLTLQYNRAADQEEGDLITLYRADSGEYRTINLLCKYKDMYGQMRTLVDMIEHNAPADPGIDDVFSAFLAAKTAEQAISQGTVLPVNNQYSINEGDPIE